MLGRERTADPEHWSYVKPARPELPAVARTAWPRTPLDRFVLARLEREKLSPSPDASKATLLRRVSLDLTGLPPTPAELDAFLADTTPDAYDRVVDRLLASPRYGERWARPWLDLARYADTNGYEKDNRRSIWKYRDWVIDALNRDLPFDQFTIEQIAGDMLPDATDQQRNLEQKIATGFHRNAMTNEEGGVDPDESMYETLVDRVNTTATVWLGSTIGCAQCHNHKYDPFSQKDYFRLLAFFANSDYESRTFGDGTRYFEGRLDLATPEQEEARKRAQAVIDGLEQELKTVTPAIRDAQEQWEQSLRAAERSWIPLAPVHARATNGVTLTALPDYSLLASGPNPVLTSYEITVDTPAQGITGLRLETVPDPSLPRSGPGRDAYGHFRVTGLHVEIAPAASAPGARGEAVTFRTIKVDDAAYPFEPADLLSAGRGPASRKSGSWAINAMRDTRARAASCGPRRADAVQLQRRHPHHGADRSPRRNHRPGHRAPAALGHHGRRPARRQRARRAAATDPGATRERAQHGARRRTGRVLPRDRTLATAHARCADGGAEGPGRPPDSLHARHEGAALVRTSVVRAARARQLHGQGRARLRTHARAPSIRCATTCRRTASAWRGGSSTTTIHSSPASR